MDAERAPERRHEVTRERLETASERSGFARVRRASILYSRHLRTIAKAVGDLLKGHDPLDQESMRSYASLLDRYAELITPWARNVARAMLVDVQRRDRRAWAEHAERMSRQMRAEIAETPVGDLLRRLEDEQVGLITSLPREAAQRVQKLSVEALSSGSRPKEIAREIMRSGEVAKSRATLIARTETARAAANLMQARALSVNSEGYVWRTAGDASVRHDHKILNGKFFRWDDPPVIDQRTGERGHPGTIYNCFPGHVRVSLGNGLKHIWRLPFDGEIVEIVTALGSTPVTANHPVLTQRGWVAAGKVCQGDYLVQALDDAHLVVERNDDKALPTFEEVFRSLQAAYPAERESGSCADFHGDVPDTYVDHIRADRGLPLDLVPDALKCLPDLPLAKADSCIGSFFAGRDNHVQSTLFSRVGDEGSTLGVGHSLHTEAIGCAGVSERAVVCGQTLIDDVPGNAVMRRQTQDAGAVDIFLDEFVDGEIDVVRRLAPCPFDYDPARFEFDAENVGIDADLVSGIFEHGARRYHLLRVVDKRVGHYTGHVFTIETLSGWFSTTSAGIIAKNCRCQADPQIPLDL